MGNSNFIYGLGEPLNLRSFSQFDSNLCAQTGLSGRSEENTQSSALRPALNDPENKLFARGPRYRLDAEVLRDIALWASELLDPHMGGEGVKPYQPGGMWKALSHPASNTKNY